MQQDLLMLHGFYLFSFSTTSKLFNYKYIVRMELFSALDTISYLLYHITEQTHFSVDLFPIVTCLDDLTFGLRRDCEVSFRFPANNFVSMFEYQGVNIHFDGSSISPRVN